MGGGGAETETERAAERDRERQVDRWREINRKKKLRQSEKRGDARAFVTLNLRIHCLLDFSFFGLC